MSSSKVQALNTAYALCLTVNWEGTLREGKFPTIGRARFFYIHIDYMCQGATLFNELLIITIYKIYIVNTGTPDNGPSDYIIKRVINSNHYSGGGTSIKFSRDGVNLYSYAVKSSMPRKYTVIQVIIYTIMYTVFSIICLHLSVNKKSIFHGAPQLLERWRVFRRNPRQLLRIIQINQLLCF